MEKKGVKKFEVLFGIFLLTVVVLLVFVLAYDKDVAGIDVAISSGAGSLYDLSFNATEDVYYYFNFTVNNTLGGLTATADAFNITEVNVTLPASFLVNGSYNNSNANGTTGAFHNFTLASGAHVMRWRNTSTSAAGIPGYLINGSNTSAWFVFNATASTPGEYTINITVLHANVSGVDANAYNITTIQLNMTVNDTTAPGILATNFVRPTANFNYSGTFVLNFSLTDNYKTGSGSQIIDYVNVTIHNRTGTYNASYKASNMTGNYWNVSINTSQFVDGVFNITIRVNDTVRSVGQDNYNSTNITILRFDNTIPVIVPSNFTNPTANNHNYSGLLVLNVSSSDTTAGMNNILFNITNISGAAGQNATTLATKSGNSFNATINTSQFPDGVYNITAWANDSAGNENNTAAMLNIRFDNTNPTATFSCTPTTVNTGNTVTCTCSPSDSTAGINTSQTSYTASPSTDNTGTHSLTCVYYDTAGNQGASVTTSYTVEMASSGASSGSSSGTTSTFTYLKTIPQTSQEFSEIQIIETSIFSGGGLGAKERVKIKINEEEHFVGIRALTETSATIEIASDPVQVELAIGEDAKVDIDSDGYYDVYVKLNGITSGKADVTIEYLNEVIPEGAGPVSTSGEDVTPVTTEEPGVTTGEETTSLTWLWWVLGIIVIAIIVWFVVQNKK